jgi:hypothetical protein
MFLRVCFVLIAGMTAVFYAPHAEATIAVIADPDNVLSGATTFASTEINAAFPASQTVDDAVRYCCPADQDHGLIFSNSDADQRLGMSGAFGALQELRIWTLNNVSDARIPNSVTIRSSLSSYSGASLVAAANYETLLGTFPLGPSAFTGTNPNTDITYATLAVDAPTGTRSLLFSFGGVGDAKGERIAEIQGFVPEPGVVALFGGTLLCGVATRRR